jgi:hypothetical protein
VPAAHRRTQGLQVLFAQSADDHCSRGQTPQPPHAIGSTAHDDTVATVHYGDATEPLLVDELADTAETVGIGDKSAFWLTNPGATGDTRTRQRCRLR